jgi:hypothetical protein
MVLQLDHLTNVVNVHWASGLAVEFGKASYLEMKAASLPNMNKGIVSLWFRDARKNAPPEPKEWPSGEWSPDTNSMIPPDVFKVAVQPAFKQNIFYWNAYGQYITGGGVTLPIFESPSVMIPSPPPFVANEVHMIMAFGSASQDYNYCQWKVTFPGVIEAVNYIPMLVTGPQWSVTAWPPPYAPWQMASGKFTVTSFELSKPEPKKNFVPQSFIGVDKNGYLTICLQTNTKATYKGYAFQIDKVTEIRATQSYFHSPITLPPTPGYWEKVPNYWDGYEFWYKDISNEVMGAQPEAFVIGGPPGAFDFVTIPPVSDGEWHHLLFSFDISGAVELKLPSTPPGGGRPPPVFTTKCKAWLALDDKNYIGGALQHRFPMHDGFQLPLLPGMGTDVTGFGPVTSAVRSTMTNLGANDILPRNCWIISTRNSPKEGLRRFASTAGLWEQESTQYINKGDYNWFAWTASIWPLEGIPGATDWRGELNPPRPSSPDPKTFDVPTYQCAGFSIPAADNPLGIPASTYHVEHSTGIEMAELQIWANVTIDTSNADARRLFISEKIDPVTGERRYVPADPSRAAEVLGDPDVLLHGSRNWINGKNTGVGGQFNPVGQIDPFKPEPELGK